MADIMEEFERTEKTLRFDSGVMTDFNMAAADYTLIFKFSWTVSQLSYDVQNGENDKVFEFFNALKELWDRVRVLLLEFAAKPIDAKFVELEPKIANLEAYKKSNMPVFIPRDLKNDLQTLKREIFQAKQNCGAGVPRRKKMTDAQRIRNALR